MQQDPRGCAGGGAAAAGAAAGWVETAKASDASDASAALRRLCERCSRSDCCRRSSVWIEPLSLFHLGSFILRAGVSADVWRARQPRGRVLQPPRPSQPGFKLAPSMTELALIKNSRPLGSGPRRGPGTRTAELALFCSSVPETADRRGRGQGSRRAAGLPSWTILQFFVGFSRSCLHFVMSYRSDLCLFFNVVMDVVGVETYGITALLHLLEILLSLFPLAEHPLG